MKPRPIVAIVGRPNVGKSSLFNRLVGKPLAIVHDEPGVTRDRHYADAWGAGREYLLVDTGGFDPESDDPMGERISEQVEVAVQEADVVVCILEAMDGVTDADQRAVQMLRRTRKPVIYAANKVDTQAAESAMMDLYRLGIPNVLPISALHGRGIGQLERAIVDALPPLPSEADQPQEPNSDLGGPVVAAGDDDAEADEVPDGEDDRHEVDAGDDDADRDEVDADADDADRDRADADADADDADRDRADADAKDTEGNREVERQPAVAVRKRGPMRIALIGRPNAGKSSIANRIVGQERLLVDDRPGTTRDAIDIAVERDGRPFVLVDTAGIRRKGKVHKTQSQLETASVYQAIRAIERCDVTLLVCDAQAGVAEQDAKILGLAENRGRGIVLALNKVDLLDKKAERGLEEKARDVLGFVPWAPCVTLSAKTGRGVRNLLDTAWSVWESLGKRIPTGELNRFFEHVLATHPPPTMGSRAPRLYFITQAETAPPLFVIITNEPDHIHFSYRRYVVNQLRSAFGFSGVPIRVVYKKRRKRSV